MFCHLAVVVVQCTALLPAPFSRVLNTGMHGNDVFILQHLLSRTNCSFDCIGAPTASNCTGIFGESTAAALTCFQKNCGISSSPGKLDVITANAVLAKLSGDNFVDDGVAAHVLGYKYKVLLPVHKNRSIETFGTLLDGQNKVLLHFKARAHGHDVNQSGQGTAKGWPDFSDTGCPPDAFQNKQGCVGLNAFSHDGSTPTGLNAFHLRGGRVACFA